MRTAPDDGLQPEASPAFTAEPLNLDGRNEKERNKLHASFVPNVFDLVGTTILRKREFDLVQAKQEQWMRIAKAPGINSRRKMPKLQLEQQESDGIGGLEPCLPFLREPSSQEVTRKRRREFADNNPSSVRTSLTLGSSMHRLVIEKRNAAKKKLLEAHAMDFDCDDHENAFIAWEHETKDNYKLMKHMSNRAEFEQLCHCNAACKMGTPAVIKCFSCIKYDPLMQGHYCEKCFLHRHPPHRLKHHYTRINDIDSGPLKQEWGIHMKRLELERRVLQYQDAINIVTLNKKAPLQNNDTHEMNNMRPQQGDATTPQPQTDTYEKRIEEATRQVDLTADTLRNLRKRLPKNYSPHEAASKLQSIWRARKAHQSLYKLLRQNITAFVDPSSGKTFYYNALTNKSTYEKPHLQRPKFTKREAASLVQALYRQKKARQGIRELVQLNLERHVDPTTGKVYYYSHGTQATFWAESAPAFVRGVEILTPRTRARKRLIYEKRQAGIFKSADKLTTHEAARMIQSRFRANQCRKKIQLALLQRMRKLVQEDSGTVYYYDTVKGTTMWEKPALLQSFQDNEIEDFHDVGSQKRTPRKVETPEEAAQILQRLWKRKKARDRMCQLVLGTYEKIFDEGTQQFYYHNTKTGKTCWATQAPAHLAGVDILTPRSRVAKERAESRKQAGLFKSCEILDETSAALMIQSCFRAKQSRNKIQNIIKTHLRKITDQTTGQTYYFNKLTQETTWVKPKLMQDLSVKSFASEDTKSPRKKRTPRVFATQDEAAATLQAMYRRKKARDRIRHLLQARFEKYIDPESGLTYYLNTVTQETTWEAPALLDEASILTPKSRERKALVEAKKARGEFRMAIDLTEEDAARMVQRNYRANRARARVRDILLKIIAKASDENGNVYYVNVQTMEATYEKPALLRRLTDSKLGSYKTLLLHNQDRKKRTPRVFASQDEAAATLQAMYRRKKARDRIRHLLQARFEKYIDPESGLTYYLNTVTQETTWEAPALLDEASILTPKSRERKALVEAKKARGEFRMAIDLTEEDAARMVQRNYRANRARARVRDILLKIIAKASDENGNVYYVNVQTMEATYEKPALLRRLTDSKLGSYRTLVQQSIKAQDENPSRGKPSRKYGSQDEAASALQGMYRRKKARDRIRALLQARFEKHYDPSSGAAYFLNTATGETSWDAPTLLNEDSVLTPKSRERKAKLEAKKDRGEFRTAKDLSDEDAARMVQRVFRANRARECVRTLLTQLIVRARDADGYLYYINMQTMEASYQKPILLRKLSDSKLGSYRTIMQQQDTQQTPQHARKYQSEEEAASALQAMYRRKQARDRVRALLLLYLEKAVDQDGHEYYFNTLTNTSSWYKPQVLKGFEVLTPRQRHQRLLAQQKRDAGLFKDASTMTRDEAAIFIQKWFRGVSAKSKLRNILINTIIKARDEHGNLYFINQATGEASWEKPTLLRDLSDSKLASFKENDEHYYE